jgi:hypothetical protein
MRLGLKTQKNRSDRGCLPKGQIRVEKCIEDALQWRSLIAIGLYPTYRSAQITATEYHIKFTASIKNILVIYFNLSHDTISSPEG